MIYLIADNLSTCICTLELVFHLERTRVEVERNVQVLSQAGVQTQSGQLVDRQRPAEQLEGQNMPAALWNCQWTAEVRHLTDRGQQRLQYQIQKSVGINQKKVCSNLICFISLHENVVHTYLQYSLQLL